MCPTMTKTIILDTTPLGLAVQRPGRPTADACQLWIADCVRADHRILVPEVADYEVRRELIRAQKATSIARLDAFNAAVTGRYPPITTTAMRLAADLWAQARNQGVPTADVQALDSDVILAAQALSLGLPPVEIVSRPAIYVTSLASWPLIYGTILCPERQQELSA